MPDTFLLFPGLTGRLSAVREVRSPFTLVASLSSSRCNTVMGRPRRIRLPGLTFHVVQRGHDGDATFRATHDYLDYLALLDTGARRFQTSIHAYVLMTNHVHLLVTSNLPEGPSQLLQYVAGRYSARFNRRYGRKGALWEGRFRASPVDSDRYCLACYRYIELNPVRAGIVQHPDAYRWSSHGANSTATASSLISPHPSFLSLGNTSSQRALQYRELIREALPEGTLQAIREGLNTGTRVGDAAFRRKMEAAAERPLGRRKRGRPRKSAQDALTADLQGETPRAV